MNIQLDKGDRIFFKDFLIMKANVPEKIYNNMNKICTSIEQSKKLIELGIDVNTADMYYHKVLPKSDKIEHTPKVGNPLESLEWYNKGYTHFGKEPLNLEEYCVPAWSLSALLKLIKSEIYGETIYGDIITYKVDFRKYKFTDDVDLYQIAYGSIKFDVDGQYSFTDMINTVQKEDPIDAAFQMVCWLLENEKI